MSKPIQLLPPAYLYFFIIAAIILHFAWPLATIIPFPLNIAGLIFIILGVVVNLKADAAIKREQTTVKPFETPSRMVTGQPFSFSRHPMYAGFVSILLGLSVLLGSLSSFIPPVLMFWVLEKKFIPHEEESLKNIFGQKYVNYQKRVRKWL